MGGSEDFEHSGIKSVEVPRTRCSDAEICEYAGGMSVAACQGTMRAIYGVLSGGPLDVANSVRCPIAAMNANVAQAPPEALRALFTGGIE